MEKHVAKWWDAAENGMTVCKLCPRNCHIASGRTGFCGVRKNQDGVLYSLCYGYPVALQVDPIEKKPLAEYLPGTKTFSFGTYGCNLNCCFCQNYHLSRGVYDDQRKYDYIGPEVIIELAFTHNCHSVAFTYNEPTVFAEYAIDVAELARKEKLGTVLVSNGYISPEAARELYPLIDAANIDMKGFSEEFYSSMTGSKFHPVLEAIKYYFSTGGHLELTNLVIPQKNDRDEMIIAWLDWVDKELSRDVPLHFSACHPDYQYDGPPTDVETLLHIRELARKRGFHHIYLGNVFIPE